LGSSSRSTGTVVAIPALCFTSIVIARGRWVVRAFFKVLELLLPAHKIITLLRCQLVDVLKLETTYSNIPLTKKGGSIGYIGRPHDLLLGRILPIMV
jgi:hypothetical protein